MKIIKTANGKKITMIKSEWGKIGRIDNNIFPNDFHE